MVKKLDNHDFLNFLNKTYGTKDSDGDGICDEVEVMIGTDPKKADTDNDGMSDGAEIRAGRNPLGPGDFHSFQDFFEAHEGNGYRPQALHPKRLLFYAASAAMLKVLLVAFVVSLPITAWLSPDVMKEQSDKIIEMTNQVRANLNLPTLKDSVSLSMAAYDKAQDMLIGQYFAHTGPDGRGVADWLAEANYSYAVAGENLAMGFQDPKQVVDAWVKSPTHYANLIDPDYSEIGVGMTSGNYHGEETTLVAQYFGEPKQVSKLQAKQVTDKQVSLAVAEAPDAKIMTKILAKPEIVAPKTDSIYTQSEVELVVRAPGADRVSIKAGAELLVTSAKNIADEYVHIKLSLPEGAKQELVAIAALGKQEQISQPVLVTIDQLPPQASAKDLKLWLEDLPGTKDKVIKIEARLEASAVSAQLAWMDSLIDLARAGNDNLWSGQAVLYHKQLEGSSLTLPVLTVKDASGNSQSYDVPAGSVRPVKGSWSERYFFLKNNPSPLISRMFNMTTMVYRVLIIMVGLALALALSLERRKTGHRTVLTTIVFAFFVLFLLII